MSTNNRELIDKFYHYFQDVRSELSSRLNAAKSSPNSEQVQAITLDLAKVQKELSDATDYLPSYDQRQCESQLKVLEQSLEDLRAASAPKTKFSFKRKPAKASAPPASSALAEAAATPKSLTPPAPPSTFSGLSFASKSHAYLTFDSLPRGLQDVQTNELTVSDLDHCVLNLIPSEDHTFSTIHVRNVKNSVLLLGTVNGSVLLHDLRRSIVVLSCHQFRMHTSQGVDVYLSIPSNPIIEHCSRIRFCSYPASLPSTTESSNIVASKHLSVQDFSHIRPTPSPNWSVLPSEQANKEWPLEPLEPQALELVLQHLFIPMQP